METVSLREIADAVAVPESVARGWFHRGLLGHALPSAIRTRSYQLPRAEALERAQRLADAWRLLRARAEERPVLQPAGK